MSTPLSPSEALLLLIEKHIDNIPFIESLKSLYLSGEGNLRMDKIFTDENMNVSYDFEVINNDATRRYFETHLAFESIKENIDTLNNETLDNYLNALLNCFDKETLDTIEPVLDGKKSNEHEEFSSYINKINTNKIYQNFEPYQTDKIKKIIQLVFLSLRCVKHNVTPLDIY